jgi:hypothetical protein
MGGDAGGKKQQPGAGPSGAAPQERPGTRGHAAKVRGRQLARQAGAAGWAGSPGPVPAAAACACCPPCTSAPSTAPPPRRTAAAAVPGTRASRRRQRAADVERLQPRVPTWAWCARRGRRLRRRERPRRRARPRPAAGRAAAHAADGAVQRLHQPEDQPADGCTAPLPARMPCGTACRTRARPARAPPQRPPTLHAHPRAYTPLAATAVALAAETNRSLILPDFLLAGQANTSAGITARDAPSVPFT